MSDWEENCTCEPGKPPCSDKPLHRAVGQVIPMPEKFRLGYGWYHPDKPPKPFKLRCMCGGQRSWWRRLTRVGYCPHK